MQLRRSPCWCRRGTTIIYIVLVLPVMMGLIGLAADTANVYWTAHQLQNAGDAAALAGAQEVAFNSTTAISNAISTAAANRAGGAAVQLAASDVLVGNYNTSSGGFTANATPYNAVQVTARRAQGSPAGPLKLIFGPIVGISTSNVSRSAIAINDTGSPNGVIVLDPTASPAVQLTGTGSNPTKIDITNGNLVVDSNSSTAVQWSGNPKIAAVAMDLAGNDTGVNSGVYESGTAQVNQTAVADPLASLPAPAKPATAGSGNPLP